MNLRMLPEMEILMNTDGFEWIDNRNDAVSNDQSR